MATPQSASAHAGLLASEPATGATLGAAPESVRLSFSEQPEVSLSEIRVLGPDGTEEQKGTVRPAGGDPLTLEVPLPRLPRGVYTVNWKIVSAVDGHATDGTYSFGVRASPKGLATESGISTPSSSPLELAARWLLLVGLVALLGAAVAALARFGGSSGSDLALAGAGWLASAVGLLLLADAQRRAAGSSLGGLLDTSVGHALIWRALAIGGAGAGLLFARRVPRLRRLGFALAAGASLVAIVVHVAAGHAAAGAWPSLITVAAQSAHFAAAGVWFGGLAALLLGVRGAAAAAKSTAIRRFATVALAALVVVFATGTLRAVDELGSWDELFSSDYGRTVLAKLALIGAITGLAALNRRRSVPAATTDLGPLRRTSAIELTLAFTAIGVAALLGTLAPPVSGQATGSLGLSASGADFGTTTRVELKTASDEPGPNRFTVSIEDYDSGDPLTGAGVGLRFTPLDDPGVEPSSLALSPGPDDTYVGSGSNLAFDGRWGIAVTVQRGAGAIEVPLELNLPGREQFVSILRPPGKPPKYTMQIGTTGQIQLEPHPERAGPSRLYVTCFTTFGSESRVDQLVLVLTAGGVTRQSPVQRLSRGKFVVDANLKAGSLAIAVVARTRDGTRLRGVFKLEIPPE
ncbi:MAG TPA: copper resistance protein CopC [Solirubrobacterales bacterium]|nr:copper resistance protein CopC [Solirubrobacterales bacterium]